MWHRPSSSEARGGSPKNRLDAPASFCTDSAAVALSSIVLLFEQWTLFAVLGLLTRQSRPLSGTMTHSHHGYVVRQASVRVHGHRTVAHRRNNSLAVPMANTLCALLSTEHRLPCVGVGQLMTLTEKPVLEVALTICGWRYLLTVSSSNLLSFHVVGTNSLFTFNRKWTPSLYDLGLCFMILRYKLDVDRVKMKRHTKYLGQRSFR